MADGAGTLKYPGASYKLTHTPWEVRSPAPTLGQDNEYLCGELLGMSSQQLAHLAER